MYRRGPYALVSTDEYKCAEFYAPEPNGLAADSDTSFSEQIFNISMAEIEAEVQTDCVRNDIWRESVALVDIHLPILPISVRLFGDTRKGVVSRKFLGFRHTEN